MRISSTLSIYIGRKFAAGVAGIFVLFLLLLLLFDVVELMRRAAAKPNVTFGMVVELSALKLPHLAQEMLPFAVLFGGMFVFWWLTRHHELVVSRAAGVSAWQFLIPALVIAFGVGLIKIAVLNPVASTLLSRYERLEAVWLKGQKSFLAISDAGLWLRQSSATGQSVVHSTHVLQQRLDVELRNVVIFNYEGADRFVERIDAESARLEKGFWLVRNAWTLRPEKSPEFAKELRLPTDLTLAKIQDSFSPPETMSFWALPGFIATLEAAGFSAIRHRLHWHALLASPFLMCAMVLIGATFSLRHIRRGGTTYIIAGGVFTGFLLYFFSDVVFALGRSDNIPAVLAAWTPSGVAILLGLAMLLHLEDG